MSARMLASVSRALKDSKPLRAIFQAAGIGLVVAPFNAGPELAGKL
ncbi:MAG: hypothetical protein KGN34_03545 [Sphingomonadales bacterium]|nr:hypothetical protein [Sphingomonadales bacterium]